LPIFIAAARLKTRRLQFLADNHRPFVRLCGDYWLQFARKPWFNPNAGELRLRFRLHSPLTSSKEDPLLFNAGCGGGCFGGNNFRLGFLGGKDLSFEVVSQRWQAVRVRARSSIRPGTWHTVVIRWGGLNDPNSKPFIEIALDGKRSRITNPVRFGEDRREGLGTGVGTEPKTFYCRPNTHLYFGAAAQRADTALACDLSEITLRCPGRKVFSPTLDHAGLAGETGSGPLAWSFIPVALRQLSARCVLLNAGSRPLAVTGAFPANMRFTSLRLPYVQTGFAGSSLKAFDPRLKGPSTRVIATADTADTLILVFADPSVCVATGQNDFRVKAGGRHFGFTVNSRGNDILSLGKDA